VTASVPLEPASVHVRAPRTRLLFRHAVATRTFDAMETAT
jgi:hypothetical protein